MTIGCLSEIAFSQFDLGLRDMDRDPIFFDGRIHNTDRQKRSAPIVTRMHRNGFR